MTEYNAALAYNSATPYNGEGTPSTELTIELGEWSEDRRYLGTWRDH